MYDCILFVTIQEKVIEEPIVCEKDVSVYIIEKEKQSKNEIKRVREEKLKEKE